MGRPEAALRGDVCAALDSADLLEEASSLYSNQKIERRLLQASEMKYQVSVYVFACIDCVCHLIHKEIRELVTICSLYIQTRLLNP